jgi:hypothetical protein
LPQEAAGRPQEAGAGLPLPPLLEATPAGNAAETAAATGQPRAFVSRAPEHLPTASPAGGYGSPLPHAFAVLSGGAGLARWDGVEWELVNTGLSGGAMWVNQIAVDPYDPSTIMIATNDGVWKTTDALDACTWAR